MRRDSASSAEPSTAQIDREHSNDTATTITTQTSTQTTEAADDPFVGGYDSSDESASSKSRHRQNGKDEEPFSMFGQFGRMFSQAKQELSALVGCSTGCANAKPVDTSNTRTPKDFNIKLEDIEELEFLGSGSEGCVFMGVLHNRKVAVKKFRDAVHVGHEVTHLKTLDHPNVVRLLGACTEPPVFCLVMELCQRSMFDVLQETKLGPAVICNWGRQVACGVHYLHSLNIVHRDLKSPNILIGKDGRTLKISDFGTARQFGPKSTPQSFRGSLSWMAPEVIRSEPCSQMVDVWSFGVVLWELLTGQVPYSGVDPAAIIYGVGMGEFELPVPKTTPPGFSLLLKQCWNLEPKHRPKMRSVLLHLQIVEDDSGFLEIPAKDYFETQKSWKKECVNEFSKMKLKDAEAAVKDETSALVRRRERELAHAEDVRRLMEKRLLDASKMLTAVKARERDLQLREQRHRKRSKSFSSSKPAKPTKRPTNPKFIKSIGQRTRHQRTRSRDLSAGYSLREGHQGAREVHSGQSGQCTPREHYSNHGGNDKLRRSLERVVISEVVSRLERLEALDQLSVEQQSAV